jgi:transposase InsO family protein
MTADLICQAVKAAYWKRKPPLGLIMHTDRGSQYASRSHRQLLLDLQMKQPVSRKANCWDNSAMESFFKPLKVECVYQQDYQNRNDARLDIVAWIEGFYNRERLHSALEYKPPHAAEELELAA